MLHRKSQFAKDQKESSVTRRKKGKTRKRFKLKGNERLD